MLDRASQHGSSVVSDVSQVASMITAPKTARNARTLSPLESTHERAFVFLRILCFTDGNGLVSYVSRRSNERKNHD
jgi:hypothetical protein